MTGRGRPRPPRWAWKTLLAQLADLCQEDDGCLLWPNGTDKNGYPKLMIDRQYWRGNRAVLYAVTGTLGPMALHSCHRPQCLNPAHLRWGTAADNAMDMWRAKRGSHNLKRLSGSLNGRSKVSEEQRVEITQRRLSGESRSSVAKAFALSETSIARITRLAGAKIPVGRPRKGDE